jgi:ketosteroid isomerase-like protein
VTREEEIHPNPEIVTRLLGRTEHGPAGLRRWFREIEEQFDEWIVTVEEWRHAGDQVAALGSVRLRGRGSGVAFDAPLGLLFEIQSGDAVAPPDLRRRPSLRPGSGGPAGVGMSPNVEVVLDQYAATNERDFRRAMSYYDDDVELVAGEPWLRTGVFKGREAVGSWFGDWFSTFDRDARFDVTEARELQNGAVLLVADHHARGRASGIEVRSTVIWVYRLRGGKITRVEGFASREQALEAAGLRE